jgi:serine/threonine protein kinase
VARDRERHEDEETELVVVPPADSRSSPPASSSSEFGLIEAARMQAQHRSRPAMRGVGGLSASIPGYTIVREIHRGGQGVVYLARQEGTGRQVAIKLMREGALARASERVRFEREIHVLATLDNPNIVTIHDSGVVGGCGYYVMDYIAGQTLEVFVRQNELGVEEILRLFAKVCHAINAAHLRGVIHRDLKPSNIRVTPEGEPHILDFGLAKLEGEGAAESSAPTRMTATGQFVGSLPWASPEQAGGESAKIDVRTDVYALGVILYDLLTGRFPYAVTGSMPEVARRIMSEIPPRPGSFNKQINSELDTIVLKALAKSRSMRYQTPGDLARDIERLLAGEPIEAKRDNWRYMSRKMFQRHWVAVTTAGVLCVSILLVAGDLFLGGGPFAAEGGLERENRSLRRALEETEAENERLRSRLLDAGLDPDAP